MKCFAGDDVTLKYWYECETCGTVVIEDHSDPACMKNWECPICKPTENFPWKFVTKEQIEESEELNKYIEVRKEMGM